MFTWPKILILICVVVLNTALVVVFRDILRKIVNDTLTGPDNMTYDFAKVGGMSGIWCLCAAELWHLYDDGIFDPVVFATAFSTILATACGSVWLKNKGGDNTLPEGTTTKSSSSVTKTETTENKTT